jgi:hypothetical protein
MRRLLACVLFAIVCAVALMTTGTYRLAMVLPLAAAAAVVWRVWQCNHPGPLGLLPPVTAADGTRQPAQWFCDGCGHSWPAIFERDQQPVRRFEGFDQSKAAGAARRADELFRRQHQMAIRRAGGADRHTTEVRRKTRRPAAQVVPLDNLRRMAK